MTVNGLVLVDQESDEKVSIESIKSIIPVCEMIYIVDCGKPSIVDSLRDLGYDNIETFTKENLTANSNLEALKQAYALIPGKVDWVIYLQDNEIIHERSLPLINRILLDNLYAPDLDGFLFPVENYVAEKFHVQELIRYKLTAFRKDNAYQFESFFRMIKSPKDYLNVALIAEPVFKFWGKNRSDSPMKEEDLNLPISIRQYNWANNYENIKLDAETQTGLGRVLTGLKDDKGFEGFNVV
jgi:hypothetical protein